MHLTTVPTWQFFLYPLPLWKLKDNVPAFQSLRYSQDNRDDGEELARGCELQSIVHLLPVSEETSFSLIRGLKRGSFHGVQQEVHALQTNTPTHRHRQIRERLKATHGTESGWRGLEEDSL